MMKKLLSLLLTLSLVLTMTTGVFAAEDLQKGSITVNNVTATTELELYKILAYDTQGILDFTNPLYKTAFVDAIGNGEITPASTPQQILGYITKNLNNGTFAKDLADALKEIVLKPANAIGADITSNENNFTSPAKTSLKFDNVNMGYYLIVDTRESEDPIQPTEGTEGDASYYTNIIMLSPIDDDIVITFKSLSYVPIEKVVDTTSSANGVSIGDTVTFTVNAVVPSTGDPIYSYAITDTMSVGLKFDTDSILLKVQDVEVAATTYTTAVSDSGFTLTFNQDTEVGRPGDKIEIIYTATVTDEAVNINTNNIQEFKNGTKVDFTHEPVEVYSYGIEITKINENKTPLEGVQFVLYTGTAGSETYLTFDANNKYTGTSDTTGTTLTTDADGKIIVFGLAKGDYSLRETYTLPGYNPLTVDKDFAIDGLINGASLTSEPYEPVEVINVSGINLPGTGGIGTTAFTAVGSVIMTGAVAMLILNKKRSAS